MWAVRFADRQHIFNEFSIIFQWMISSKEGFQTFNSCKKDRLLRIFDILLDEISENHNLSREKLYFANCKCFQQSASINSEVLSCFPFVNFAFFYFRYNIFDDSTDRSWLYQLTVILSPLSFILFFEGLHILSRFHQFLLILSQWFQENTIFHLILKLMHVR